MASQLPRHVALKSNYNSKYLYCIAESGEAQRFLQFSGETVVSPYAKYEVEEATSGNQGFVHIRCCYNNKYWVRQSESTNWIIAAADEPEEDQSKWSCTLFAPLFTDDGAVQLRHVQSLYYAYLWQAAAPYNDCLYLGSSTPGHTFDVFTIFDWDTLVVLPKYIAFKGNNGQYLNSHLIDDHEYLQFGSDDIEDSLVHQQVFYTQDGHVRIMANYYNKFWRRSANWIWSDSTDTTSNNLDTVFWPVKVDDNVIALRNEGNGYFCKRLTDEGKTNCLNAAVPNITQEARLEMAELVVSRSIYDVNYHLTDARIYDENVLTLATEVAINETQEPKTVDLKLSYTETSSSTWSSSVSVKLFDKISFEAGIPRIIEGKVELSGEFTGTYQWGQTQTSTNVVETTYEVNVPAMSIVNINLLATKGTCDVPFSYTQHDVKIDGESVTYYLDDGVYTGTNCYQLKFEIKEEPLPA